MVGVGLRVRVDVKGGGPVAVGVTVREIVGVKLGVDEVLGGVEVRVAVGVVTTQPNMLFLTVRVNAEQPVSGITSCTTTVKVAPPPTINEYDAPEPTMSPVSPANRAQGS